MKLATFSHTAAPRIGVVLGDEVIPLDSAAPELPREMPQLLAAGDDALDTAARAATASDTRLPLASVRLHPPILRPPKILAIGLNYADHIAETGREAPKVPTVFNKQATAANGPNDPIHRPKASDKLDYEGELGFVIGRRCRHVPRQRAHEVIAGYTIVNDVTVRDWQAASPTMTMGKSWDTHCPFGPWITTADEVSDPHDLGLRTWVNGELRQDSNTKHLIFDCFALVEHLSTAFSLEPGDLISTGTPSGVGIGFKPRRFLAANDVVRIEIDGLGGIENRVIEEPDTTRLI
jgi:2-keto-4-pentenoate hydratase/2-oxohepta-3-ene-1,7-dioic acid hydratase in catechol pathway